MRGRSCVCGKRPTDPFALSADGVPRSLVSPGAGKLLVSEVFGPTLQGEGPHAGRAASFVRLGGCNLTCSWCDTSYTWDAARHDLRAGLTARSTEEVAAQVLTIGAPLVVITGGEPALQSAEAARLARLLTARGLAVELETAGTVPLGPLAEQVRLAVISPKLASSGVPERVRLRWHVLSAIAALPQAVLKFVVQDQYDLAEADEVVRRLGTAPDRVWVMPEGTSASVLLERMAELAGPVAARGWSLSGRLQILLWANQRGR